MTDHNTQHILGPVAAVVAPAVEGRTESDTRIVGDEQEAAVGVRVRVREGGDVERVAAAVEGEGNAEDAAAYFAVVAAAAEADNGKAEVGDEHIADDGAHTDHMPLASALEVDEGAGHPTPQRGMARKRIVPEAAERNVHVHDVVVGAVGMHSVDGVEGDDVRKDDGGEYALVEEVVDADADAGVGGVEVGRAEDAEDVEDAEDERVGAVDGEEVVVGVKIDACVDVEAGADAGEDARMYELGTHDDRRPALDLDLDLVLVLVLVLALIQV